jgi:hypothetical protein
MIPRLRVVLIYLSVALCLSPQLAKAQKISPDRLWQSVDKIPAAPANARVGIRPATFKTFTLDAGLLRSALAKAPREFTAGSTRDAGVQITLPMPDGTFARFKVEESPVMAAELAAKFPAIKSYFGRGIDDRSASLHLDINPRTFHAQILSPSGAVYIDPYWHLDGSLYMSYKKNTLERDPERFKCLVESARPSPEMMRALAEIDNADSGKTLRTYRLACATSLQYSQYHSADPVNPTVPEVLAALVTLNNRVSGIYRRELGIRMVLIANNDLIIATPTNPGPYTDTPADIELNGPYLDTKIGEPNYDIGHVVTVGSGGVAGLGVVCQGPSIFSPSSEKAAGTTGFDPPINDPFWVDYVAHEMGHQFGGNHTFNGSGTNCGAANQNPETAYEPGSGSTIQAYAGICGAANNLQPNSDPYFHFISLEEMFAYSTEAEGSDCPVETATGNNPPTVNARAAGVPPPPTAAFTIPDQTSFALTALNGADPDSDPITYCWEEADLGPEKAGNAPDNGLSALFRSFLPTPNPTRTFPRWSDLLANNTQTIGEKLPLTTRKLDFRITVRDDGGGFGMDSIRLNVVNSGTGFAVTAPNTAVTFQGGSTQTVTWNVAGTTANGINTSNVNILLSTDATPAQGDPVFPIVLAANTPNDGSQTVTIPFINTSKARVMVKAVGNVYFDISNVNFTITSPAPQITSAVSRKIHGPAGPFNIGLPLVGDPGIECRSGGTNDQHTIIVTFANTLTGVSGVNVTGTGNASGAIGTNPRQYIVNLNGVTNEQLITVNLLNVTDSAGNGSSTIPISMIVLAGDTNADKRVNVGDTNQTRSRAGQLTNDTNKRSDVNLDGRINVGDTNFVRAHSGDFIP